MVVLRPAVPSDEPDFRRIFAGTRAAELSALGPGPASDAFLDSQYRLQLGSFLGAPAGEPIVYAVVQDGAVVGRLLVSRRPGTLHLVDIAVAPEVRGRRIGTSALSELVTMATDERREVTLHVEATNPAVRLYERLGFVEDGAEDDLRRTMRRPLS